MKGDKKKFMVLGALAVVIVCVGAFQIMSSGSPATAPAKEKKTTTAKAEYTTDVASNSGTGAEAEYNADTTGETGDVAKNGASESDPLKQLYSINLAARDPFDTVVALPITDPLPKATPNAGAPRTTKNWNPAGINVPPMPPLQGELMPNGANPNGQIPNLSMPPQGPTYSVSGIIRGEKNAAVISDAQGNQRLVKEGQAIDGDASVVSVQKGKVVIRKKDGKTITLSVGGNP